MPELQSIEDWSVPVAGIIDEEKAAQIVIRLEHLAQIWRERNRPALDIVEGLRHGLKDEEFAPVERWLNDGGLGDMISGDTISIVVCSPGGSFNAALAIVDSLQRLTVPTTLLATGLCGSAGALVTAAGPKPYRIATPNTRFFLHELQVGYEGSANGQLNTWMENVKEGRALSIKMLADYTGKSVEEIAKVVADDAWFNAKQAVELGLIDAVLGEGD